MYRFLVLGAFILALAASASSAYAIDIPGTNQLSIDISPQNPRPYQTITISPSSTALDLAGESIQVFVNGTKIDEGTGTMSTAVTLGGPGVPTTIKIVATDSAGSATSAQIVLRPADVSLIIEPNTTAHPFYEGGLLVAPESPIRIVAITDFRNSAGAQVPSSSLVYTWKFGDRVLESDSGIGRSVLNAVAPVKYRDADIDLTVQSPDSTLVGEATVTVSPVDPVVRLYQHDPLLGVLFNTAMTNSFSMVGTEATFRAVSYYFSGMPTYAWTVNSTASGAGSDLTVRANGSGAGSALVGATATDSTGKTADTILSVLFGTSASSGIFGL